MTLLCFLGGVVVGAISTFALLLYAAHRKLTRRRRAILREVAKTAGRMNQEAVQ